jgi:L-alanine-DL-glutamate epimerase-like enolase superfamily enzyme
MEWSIKPIKLELKYTWKLSRNSSDYKINYLIGVKDGLYSAQGEVAPNIRYNETPEVIEFCFEKFTSQTTKVLNQDLGINIFTNLLNELDLPHALRFGIESAYIHLQCAKNKQSLNQYLQISEPNKVATCYTLPIMEHQLIAEFYNTYNLARFQYIKIKVNAETGLEELAALSKVCHKPLMIDANETWKNPDDLIAFMKQLSPYNIAFVEQPMPSAMEDAYRYLKPKSPYVIMADESCLAEANINDLQYQFAGINMKLMKSGGYLNGLRIINEAKELGLKTMVGCMVETTLGMSGAWALCGLTDYADLDGYMIIKDEPFNILSEENGWVEMISNDSAKSSA